MKPLAAAIVIVALCTTPQTAAAQVSGAAPFCLQTVTGTRCVFSSMGECEAAKGRTTYFEQCLTRTDTQGTTGLGRRPAPSGPSYQGLPPVKPQDLGR